jgi:hypothetical protein
MPFYIKYHVSDVVAAGTTAVTRPAANPPGPWLSPSVWFTEANSAATLPGGKPRVGEACDIRVRVDVNGPFVPGEQVSQNVTVQVWVCDFMMGAPGPASVPPGGSTAGGLQQQGPLEDTDPVSSGRVAVFDWTPQPGDFRNVVNNEAHMCIGANAYLRSGGTTVEGAEVTSGGLDIWNNPHHAQKNIDILAAINDSGDVPIGAINYGEEEEEFLIEVLPLRRRLGFPELELLLAMPFVRRVGGKRFDPREFLKRLEGVPSAPLERFALERGGDLVLGLDKTPLHRARGGAAVAELEFEGKTGKRLEVTLPPIEPEKGPRFINARLKFKDADDIGAVQAIDFVQRRRDGTEAGGARFVFVNLRPDDLKWGADAAEEEKGA